MDKPRYQQPMSGVASMMALLRAIPAEIRNNIDVNGLVYKKAGILHVNLKGITALEYHRTCICAFAVTTGELEGFARELCEMFSANEVIIHDSRRPESETATVEVLPGTMARISELPGSLEGDTCGTHPFIKGLVSWSHDNKTKYYGR